MAKTLKDNNLENTQPEPSFYSVTPATVRYCKGLEPNAKLLYGEITALCNKKGFCWATNKYFADLYEVTPRAVRQWLESLKKFGFIKIVITKNGFNSSRKIYLSEAIPKIKKVSTEEKNCRGGRKKIAGGEEKNCLHNNTVNNTINISKTFSEREVEQPIVEQRVVACGAVVVSEKKGNERVDKKQPILEDDVYFYANKVGKDWTTQEIESAFRVYKASKYEISDSLRYIEGVINKTRITKKNKDYQCSNQKKKKYTEKDLKPQSTTPNQNCSESVIVERPSQTLNLRDILRQSGISC